MPGLAATTSHDLFTPVLSSRAFAVGLALGALAYLATGLLAAITRRSRDGAGIAFAAAALLAIRDVFGARVAPAGLFVAIALLAIGGALATRMRPRMAARWYVAPGRAALALTPGALALALAFPIDTPSWLRFAVAAGALISSVLVMDFDKAQGAKGAPLMLLAISAIAVYFTVPDTELPLVMLGCALPLALLSIPQPLRRLGPAGTAAAMGVFAWVVVAGGAARGGSIVAGLATLGLLVAEPVGRRIPKSTLALAKPRRRRAKASDAWIVVVAVAAIAQTALGLFCATIAGREVDVGIALLMVTPALVLLAAAAPVLLPAPDATTRSHVGSHVRRRSRSRSHAARP
jgi:hypothetical protein